MSRGVATILGILALFGGGLMLWAAFTGANPVTLFHHNPGTFSQAGTTPTPPSNVSTGTSGGGGQFTAKTQ